MHYISSNKNNISNRSGKISSSIGSCQACVWGLRGPHAKRLAFVLKQGSKPGLIYLAVVVFGEARIQK
jgi:hypothetical protein